MIAFASSAAGQYGATVPLWVTTPTQWPGQQGVLQWCEKIGPAAAAAMIMAGIIYLIFGVKIYRFLITANAFAIGAAVGATIGARANAEMAGAFIGGIAGAAAAWPMIKWSVAVTGGVCGAFLGACIWRMSNQNPQFAWAGALTGLVALGMFSFILFRISVIIYLSIQGGAMLVFGVLGLAYKYQDAASSLSSSMNTKPFLLPMLLFLPMICGLIYQHHMYGAAEPAGGPGRKGGGGKKHHNDDDD
ncbi:MAG TPA: hypothetical protein VG722_00480 [Tepidisphaeraceae bacterium]|nr:hypothetical protein [Tepidisphaeraceae bacterium]